MTATKPMPTPPSLEETDQPLSIATAAVAPMTRGQASQQPMLTVDAGSSMRRP